MPTYGNAVRTVDNTGNILGTSTNPLIVTAGASSSDIEGGGKVAVGTTAIEVTFAGTTKSIIITADKDNSGLIYVGESNVDSSGNNAMTYLQSGDSLTIDFDDSSNAVYVVADSVSQNFWKGALV